MARIYFNALKHCQNCFESLYIYTVKKCSYAVSKKKNIMLWKPM